MCPTRNAIKAKTDRNTLSIESGIEPIHTFSDDSESLRFSMFPDIHPGASHDAPLSHRISRTYGVISKTTP
jgi:hypothetical protein